MPTVLELKENRAQVWERMKQLVDGAEAGNRSFTAEEQANWGQSNADIEALEERIKNQEHLERAPARADHPRQTAVLDTRNQASLRTAPEYRQAFENWLRVPRAVDLDPESRSLMASGFTSAQVQVRAMGTNVPTAGGYLVPETLEKKIEQALLWYGGMREVGEVIRTESGNDLAMPTSDDTTNTGEILAENTAATEQDATIGARILKAYMYSSKIVRASHQFLQDPAIDVESWLADLLAIRIGRITNTHFTTGTGANQPSGIAGDSTQGVAGATGQSTSVTWDDLITLEHSVDRAYRFAPGCRYMLRDSTLRELRKLKDGEGRYLWQPGMPNTGVGAIATINGYPYTINNDVAAMAASATAIFFGDLKKYKIRDVRGWMLLRLEERYAEYLQVGFLGFSRHDGVLLDAGSNPVKHYSNSAT